MDVRAAEVTTFDTSDQRKTNPAVSHAGRVTWADCDQEGKGGRDPPKSFTPRRGQPQSRYNYTGGKFMSNYCLYQMHLGRTL